mmetsp:Transcript_51993/g.129456  ORF Transcript_51993/g.129456 Transcript_51993/m.129456 type:complete len:397 (-) Transcript_51993:82-1272(-)
MQAVMRSAARPLLGVGWVGACGKGTRSKSQVIAARPLLGAGWVGVCGKGPGSLVISRAVASLSSANGHHREHRREGNWTFAGRYGVPVMVGSAACVLGGQCAIAEEDAVASKLQLDQQAEGDTKQEQHAVEEDRISQLVEESTKLLNQALATLKAEVERAWEHLKQLAMRATEVFSQLQERVLSSLASAMSERGIADETSSGSAQSGSVEEAQAKGAERELGETELAPSVWAVPESVEKYFPVFVFFSIVLGVLTFNLMLRSRDTTYAKLGANQAGKAVRAVSAATHPRRATNGGPLQENEVTTGLVREVLGIVASYPPVIQALGNDIKEGRMSMVKDKKGGVAGSMALVGHKGEHATVECHAVKDAVEHSLSCTSITVRLPGTAEPLIIPLATSE